jgi:hypothetical protein
LGAIVSGGVAVYNIQAAARKTWGVHKAHDHHMNSLAGQTASAAIRGLILKMERERNADWVSAAVSTTEFGGKLAATAMDGGMASGTAISLAANVAKLTNIIRIVYRDVNEKKNANIALKGTLDIKIFDTSPLIGAYFVCCAPTSVLMEMILKEFGEAGWMERANEAQRHLDPLKAAARGVIAEHRFEIRKLADYPGVRGVNTKGINAAIKEHQAYDGY